MVVVDDEPLARERMSGLVRAAPDLTLAGEARNGLEALDVVVAVRPDVVLLDIEMPVVSGLGVVSALDGESSPAIVFVTAHDHYAVRAFEVGAIDYILKPVTEARFVAAMARVRERLDGEVARRRQTLRETAARAERDRGWRQRYVAQRGHRHYLVAVDRIEYISASDNYLKLRADGETHLVRGTLADAEGELDPAEFVRVHRSTLVATRRIRAVRRLESGGYLLTLHSGAEVRVSRRYLAALRSRFG